MAAIICGVDVSSETLDARIGPDGPALKVARSVEGIGELEAFCRAHGADLVAMEATGGYERLAFALLWESGIACAVLNPRQVRRFAEAMGFLEKTDAIDAGVIAHYAAVKGIVPQEPASAAQQRLAALVTRLRQLTAARVAQANQRRLVNDPEVRASIDETEAFLRRQSKAFEIAIAQILHSDPLWVRLNEVFRQIAGVGERTVATLLAEMPEIGTLSNKAVAKLAGLAPIARDSGKLSARRPVRGGRAPLRSILFVVASVVGRYDPDFKLFRERLIARGKAKMAVRVAIARKLLVRLNAKARDIRKSLATA